MEIEHDLTTSDALAAPASTAPTPSPPSTSRQAFCEVCTSQPFRYTCPGCLSKSCSLACTNTHKADTGCTGVREKAAYVPMASYSDVAMWRDLSFLREVGEKVKEWGSALNLPSQEALNKKERQLQNSRKGKGREQQDNGRPQVVHDRLKTLSQRELKLRRNLMLQGVEILFLPKDMERHKLNRSGFLDKKRKVQMTLTIHLIDESKVRSKSKTSHGHDLQESIDGLVKKAFPEVNASLDQYGVLLPVPVRPVVFSRNEPVLEPAKPLPAARPPRPSLPPPPAKSKALPPPPSSLPMKPSWLSEPAPLSQPEPEQPPEPEKPKILLPEASARQAWSAVLPTSLIDALKGTSILEWPEFEVWPLHLLQEELAAGRLEYAERRLAFDRDWKRKRDDEDDQDEQSQPARQSNAQGTAAVQAEDDACSDSDSSDDSDSSSSDADDNTPLASARSAISVEAASGVDHAHL